MKEHKLLEYLYQMIVGLAIPKCDVYLQKPMFMGKEEKRNKSYVALEMPNGITDKGAFSECTVTITVGAKDKVIGLPNMPEIQRIAQAISTLFDHVTEDYTMTDFVFTSDAYDNLGTHEYYYTFHIYINS